MEVADHVLVGVLPVAAYSLLRHRRRPGGSIVFAALAGSLLPDAVDKPLAWVFGVVPSGRMVAHSLVIAVPVVLCALAVAYRLDRPAPGVAFGYAYLAHLAGDFSPVLALGSDYYFYPNMFWPLVAANPDPDPGFASHVPAFSAETAAQLAVLVALVGYIAFDLRWWWVKRLRTL